jgi:hypothetical protein
MTMTASMVLRPVDARHHGREVEADQHDDGAGDDRRQHGVDQPAAEEVDDDPHDHQDYPGDEDGTGDVRGVPALGADGDDAADERRRRAEVARHLPLDDEQEADGRDPAHHDGELRVEPHDDREDEGRSEHRDHVLRAQTDGPGPGEPFVRADDGAGGRRLSIVDDAPAE